MSGIEKPLSENAFLVSETDNRGIITYANDQFCNIVEYTKEELVGQPHNIVRHEDMPKAAFEDLWNTVKTGQVWQGYVKNRTKSGDFYWVFATVYPYKNEADEQCYMSIRRKPCEKEVQKHDKLYKSMF